MSDTKPLSNADKLQENAGNTAQKPAKPVEIGGPKGLEPTRYGDWEQKGRCTDF